MQELNLPRTSMHAILKEKTKYIGISENIENSVINVSYRREELLVKI